MKLPKLGVVVGPRRKLYHYHSSPRLPHRLDLRNRCVSLARFANTAIRIKIDNAASLQSTLHILDP
jgi:hypothetical protein